MERPDCFGFTIFCDDIRHEVGGKISYIGAYRGTMYIHVPLPAALTKLGCSVSLMRTFDHIEKLPGTVVITVHLPDDPDERPSIVAELPAEQINQMREQIVAQNQPDITHVRLDAVLVLSPFTIQAFGSIKVRAVLPDGDKVKLGGLVIAAAPKQS